MAVEQGKLAVIANTGPLAVPLTKTEYNNKSKPRPQNLFSHSDRRGRRSMTSTATGYSSTGVGGRIADLVDSQNVPPPGPHLKIATCISITSMNTYQVAETTQAYQINSSGPVGNLTVAFFSYNNNTAINNSIAAFNEQITRLRGNHFETQWGGMMNYSLQTKTAITNALAANPLPGSIAFSALRATAPVLAIADGRQADQRQRPARHGAASVFVQMGH